MHTHYPTVMYVIIQCSGGALYILWKYVCLASRGNLNILLLAWMMSSRMMNFLTQWRRSQLTTLTPTKWKEWRDRWDLTKPLLILHHNSQRCSKECGPSQAQYLLSSNTGTVFVTRSYLCLILCKQNTCSKWKEWGKVGQLSSIRVRIPPPLQSITQCILCGKGTRGRPEPSGRQLEFSRTYCVFFTRICNRFSSSKSHLHILRKNT